MKDIKIFLKKKKIEGEKRLEKDIKILLQKKKKKDNVISNVRRSYLTIAEIIIQHKKSNYWIFFKDPRAIRLVSRLNPCKEILKNFYGFKDFFLLKDFLSFMLDLLQVTTFPTTALVQNEKGVTKQRKLKLSRKV